MEVLYQETNSLLQQMHAGLASLERASDQTDAAHRTRLVQQQLQALDANCARLDQMVAKEPPNRRQTARYKVDQLKYDCQSVHSALSGMKFRLDNKWRAAAEREELLNRRYTTNDSTQVLIDEGEMQLNDRLHSSHSAMDDLLAQGSAVLESLQLQHLNLRGVKRRILDVGQQLGLSSTTLRFIERRVGEDWIIFAAGCILVLILMFVFYRFWKG